MSASLKMKSRVYVRQTPSIDRVLTDISSLFHIECGDEHSGIVLLRNKINIFQSQTTISASVKISFICRFVRRLFGWSAYVSCISNNSATEDTTHVTYWPVLGDLSALEWLKVCILIAYSRRHSCIYLVGNLQRMYRLGKKKLPVNPSNGLINIRRTSYRTVTNKTGPVKENLLNICDFTYHNWLRERAILAPRNSE